MTPQTLLRREYQKNSMTKFARLGNIITVVEVLALGALVIVELLSGHKAGIMHHLYFKKVHYLSTLYHEDNLSFHLASLLLCALILGYSLQRRRITNTIRRLIPFGSVCLLLVFCYVSPITKEINVYAYLLMCLECCVVLETLRSFLHK